MPQETGSSDSRFYFQHGNNFMKLLNKRTQEVINKTFFRYVGGDIR